MQLYSQKQNDLTKIIQTIFRKKWLILLCIVGTLTPIFYYNKISLPVYESTALVVCEESHGTLSPLSIANARLENTFIINQLQELKSWSLASEVVKALPGFVLKSFPKPDPLPPNFDENEFYTSTIQQSISGNPVTNSDVIRINAEAHNARAASVIANTVAEILKNRNLKAKIGEIANVRTTIEEQLKVFKDRVEETERALKEFKERNKVTFLDQESQEIFRRITEAEVEFNRVKTAHDAADKRLSFLQQKLSEERQKLVPSITTTTSPWAQRLKENLIELEVQYTTLKVQDYNDNHPQMKRLKTQIEETKKNLRKETLKIAKGETTIDPLSQIQQNLEEIASLEVEIHTYEAQEKALQEVLNNYNNTLKTVPGIELELGRLMRDKAVTDNIYTMLLQQREQAKITEAEKTGNIRIIDPARIPKSPIRPRKIFNLFIGIIIGSGLGIGLALFLESMNDSIMDSDEVEQAINLPVFATIPRIKSNTNGTFKILNNESTDKEISALTSKLIAGRDLKSPATEAFRALRTNIQFADLASPVKSIMITSATPNEGKSLIVANLAIVTAQMGLKTLLIDLDLRKPVQHSLFGKKLQPGIMDLLVNSDMINTPYNFDNNSNNNISNDYQLPADTPKTIHELTIPNLSLLTCGSIPSNPSEILASIGMKEFLDKLKEDYQVILLDTPPALTITDAAIIGRIAEGIILVVRAQKISKREITKTAQVLKRLKGNLIGSVFNGVDRSAKYYSYYDKY